MFDFLKTSHLYANTPEEWDFFRCGTDDLLFFHTNHMSFDRQHQMARVFVKYYVNRPSVPSGQYRVHVEPEHANTEYFGSMLIDLRDEFRVRIDEGFMQGDQHVFFSEKQIPWRAPVGVEKALACYCLHLLDNDLAVPPADTPWQLYQEGDGYQKYVGLFNGSPQKPDYPLLISIKQVRNNGFISYHSYDTRWNGPEQAPTVVPWGEVIFKKDKCVSAFYSDDVDKCPEFANCWKTFPLISLSSDQLKACCDEVAGIVKNVYENPAANQ